MDRTNVLAWIAVVALITTGFVPLIAGGVFLDKTADGSTAKIIDFTAAGSDSTTVAIALPAAAQVRDANITLEAGPHTVAGTDYPTIPAVDVGNDATTDWTFAGTGYGAWGYQTLLSDDSATGSVTLTGPGSDVSTTFKMPAKAAVTTATMDLLGKQSGWGALPGTHKAGPPGTVTFGMLVVRVGDVNNDGWDDVAVGDPLANAFSGSVYVYHLGAAGLPLNPSTTIPAPTAGFFGAAIDGGDFNDDGFSDIIVGEPGAVVGGPPPVQKGKAHIFLGSAAGVSTTPDWTFTATLPFDRGAGIAVAAVGDLDGDLVEDFTVTDWNNTNRTDPGVVYVFYGGDPLPVAAGTTIPNPSFVGRSLYGLALDGVDINSDGYSDLLIGDAGWTNNRGRLHVHLGSPTGVPTAPTANVDGQVNQYLGVAVASVGDVNNDAYNDAVVVGASASVAVPTALVYHGTTTGWPAAPARTYTAPVVNEGYFQAVAAGGFDANGDGIDDLAFGHSGLDIQTGGFVAAQDNNGSVVVYFGTNSGAGPTPAVSINGSGDTEYLGNALASVALDGDSYRDLLVGAHSGAPTGRVYPYTSGPAYPLNLVVDVGNTSTADYTGSGYLNGTAQVSFAAKLQTYLATLAPGAITVDASGNEIANVPVRFTSQGKGVVDVTALKVQYVAPSRVPGLAADLQAYLAANQAGAVNGTITVPVKVSAGSAGKITVRDIAITYVVAPKLVMPIPSIDATEDERVIVDLGAYFTDDDVPGLGFTVSYVSDKVVLSMAGDRLTVDATGQNGTNWWGKIDGVTVTATDSDGLRLTSNAFTVWVNNTNDAPVFTNPAPPDTATVGSPYTTTVTATDIDPGSVLSFSMVAADSAYGPTVGATSGDLSWTPGNRYGDAVARLTVAVSDGIGAPVLQPWDVTVAKGAAVNHAPTLITLDPPPVTAGSALDCTVCIVALDQDPHDVLVYTLTKKPTSMTIDPLTAKVDWNPLLVGREEVQVQVDDGVNTATGTFHVWVVTNATVNRGPAWVSTPPTAAVREDSTWTYMMEASDPDPGTYLDYGFELELTAPPNLITGLRFDEDNRTLSWTPRAGDAGTYQLQATASDGLIEIAQAVTINVSRRGPVWDVAIVPLIGLVTGTVTVTATAVDLAGGPVDLVEISVGDNATWLPMTHGIGSNWTYVWDTSSVQVGDTGLATVTLFVRAHQGPAVSPEVTDTVTVTNGAFTGDFLTGLAALCLIIAIVIIVVIVVVVVVIYKVIAGRRAPPPPPPGMMPPMGGPMMPPPMYGPPGMMPPGGQPMMPPQTPPPYGGPPPGTPPQQGYQDHTQQLQQDYQAHMQQLQQGQQRPPGT